MARKKEVNEESHENIDKQKKNQQKKGAVTSEESEASENIPPAEDVKPKKHRHVKSELAEEEDEKESLKDKKPKKHRHKELVAPEDNIEDTSDNEEKPKENRKRKSEALEDTAATKSGDDKKSKKNRSNKSRSADLADNETSEDVEVKKNHKKKSKKSHEPGEATESSDDVGETSKKSTKNRKKKSIKSAATVESDDEDVDAEISGYVDDSFKDEKHKKHREKHSDTSQDTATASSENVSTENSATASVENVKPKKRRHTNSDTTEGPPKKIPAIKFIDIIQALDEHGKEKLHMLKGTRDISKLLGSIPELDEYHDFFTLPSFNTDFYALYSTAMRRKNISLDLVVTVINRYLNDGASVEHFDGFPKAPLAPPFVYAAEHKDAAHSTLKDFTESRKQFTSGNIDTKPYYDKYAKECEKYIGELKQFMEDNSLLLRESHIDHINSMVTKTSKNIHSKDFGKIKKKRQNNSVTSKPEMKKKKRTAFDIFKDANPDLYADRDEETRNRKLERKFNKLSEEERNVYEKIAIVNA